MTPDEKRIEITKRDVMARLKAKTDELTREHRNALETLEKRYSGLTEKTAREEMHDFILQVKLNLDILEHTFSDYE